MIQKLVFPFSRMSYRPANETQFFSKLEMVLELKALSSPLATVNILMSLFQLGHFPSLVLHRVFSPSFISNVTSESIAFQISALACYVKLVLYHYNEFQIIYVCISTDLFYLIESCLTCLTCLTLLYKNTIEGATCHVSVWLC